MISTNDVLNELKKIQDPDLHKDIVSLGFIKNLVIDGNAVRFDIDLTTPACPVKDQMESEARKLVSALPGVKKVEIKMTASVRSSGIGGKKKIEGVRNIIAVASGKGGVGKSTLAVNLAVAMAQTGASVGLLDADIYGPTVPLMMGPGSEIDLGEDKKIIPAKAHGISYMSMGFMAPGDKPLIWRGPMAHNALTECLFNVKWGDLDYLFIDLPPGTGDVHLTLTQSVDIAGAVVVSTPQDIGLTISLKTFRMFETMKVKILGLIENMSAYVCSHCGEVENIFGESSVEKTAQKLNLPFLGSIPLTKAIREQADKGIPLAAAAPTSTVGLLYKTMAQKIAQQVSVATFAV